MTAPLRKPRGRIRSGIKLLAFVIVIYETSDNPGEVVVAYRPFVAHGSAASKAALAEAEKLLDGIARDATK